MRTSEIFYNISLNLWDADAYGDGTHSGKVLTAYRFDEVAGETNYSKFVSVSLTADDLPITVDFDNIDDEWFSIGDPNFILLLEVFLLRLIEGAK